MWVVDFCEELNPCERIAADLDEVDELVREDGDFGVFAEFVEPCEGHLAWGLFLAHVLDEGFFGAGVWGEGDGVFVGRDFAEKSAGDVLRGGFFDSRRADEEGVKVGLDVADDTHVFPEVGAATG